MFEKNDVIFPLVSVIIRSIDRSTLAEALDSVASQNYPNIEVILVNAKGADHQDAKVNLARQVASIALCLLKNNDKYNENYGDYLKERKKTQKEFFEQSL